MNYKLNKNNLPIFNPYRWDLIELRDEYIINILKQNPYENK